MERKIGEIFEYNGEWYQTVKSQGKCCSCDFMIDGHCIVDFSSNGSCFYCHRKDKENIIFKKLEEVGEPYSYNGIVIQKYKIENTSITISSNRFIYLNGPERTIGIEIKQNKEAMEEKKYCDGCKYSDEEMKIIEKAEKDVRKAIGGAFGLPKDIPYLHSFVSSALELGWLDKYKEHPNSEKIEKDLKEFSLEAAKAGKPVCTRDGRKARIICFDKKEGFPIIALVETRVNDRISEEVALFNINGRAVSDEIDSKLDLMMSLEKKEGWVNIDKGGSGKIAVSSPYSTKEEAIHNDNETTIDTIKIYWEE